MYRKLKKYSTIMLVVISLFLISCNGSETVSVKTDVSSSNKEFNNPILPAESADPWIAYIGDTYFYIYSRDDSIRIKKAQTIQELRNGQDTVVWSAPENSIYSKDIWAPELHYINGKWYIYFSADDGNNSNHRMYVLEGGSQSDNPLSSTFHYKGKLGDKSDKWAIDGTVLQKKDGSLYMVWSGWEGDMNGKQNLYIANMDTPWSISGDRVMISEPAELWERIGMPINEGPEVLLKDNKILIIYSASGSWTGDSCLGMLVNNDGDVLNKSSWKKTSSPVFQKSVENKVYGVGHCSFIKSSDGKRDWIVYHAMDKPDAGWQGRSARIQSFLWNTDGTPNFGVPVSKETFVQEPVLK